MAKVEIEVNGRGYQVTCEDGQEMRLKDLAAYLDRHVAELVESLGQIGEARLLLLSALTVCDELFEARAKARERDEASRPLDAGATGAAIDTVETARRRVEHLAERLAEAAPA